jgi:hypothetical protein
MALNWLKLISIKVLSLKYYCYYLLLFVINIDTQTDGTQTEYEGEIMSRKALRKILPVAIGLIIFPEPITTFIGLAMLAGIGLKLNSIRNNINKNLRVKVNNISPITLNILEKNEN